MSNDYITTIYSLLIVLSVICFFLYLFKKFKFNKFSSNKFINVIQIIPIGNKEKIILLEAHNNFILVGATANSIKKLHVFNNMETEVAEARNKFTVKYNEAESYLSTHYGE